MSVPTSPDQWRGRRVVVLGLGITGFAVADTLAELHAAVTVIAGHADPERVDVLSVVGAQTREIADPGATIEALEELEPEVVVVSPGYRPDSPIVQWVVAAGILLLSDIDVAWLLRDLSPRPAEWICITGTDGKTTTTQLTAAMIEASGKRAAVCGNIGIPVLDRIRDPEGFDFLVVELSSFQLHYTNLLSPWSAACLNIADDHIDWHGSKDAYVAAKAKVFHRVKKVCLYNADDPVTERLVEQADVVEGARAVGFTLGAPGISMVGIVDGVLLDRAFIETRAHEAQEITTVEALADRGMGAQHLLADVLAASALARSAGVTIADIQRALAQFHLGAHRIQPVADIAGVLYIDDSKATNSHSANAALEAFDSIVWIVGGLLKGVDITPLVEQNASRLRGAVVIGVDQQPVLDALRRHAPDVPIIAIDPGETGVMDAAVEAAASLAQSGDVVLMAPAAASMDQFRDYADRGQAFVDAVRIRETGGHTDGASSSVL